MQSEIQIIQTLTSEFLAKVKYISGLSQGNDTRKKFRYRITPALFKAFTSIVMFYVLHGLAGVERDRKYGLELYQACEECTDQCFELLNEGVDHLLILLHTDDDGGTVRYAEPESKTIIAMVMENLLNRPLKFETHEAEISDIYSEFISELVCTSPLGFSLALPRPILENSKLTINGHHTGDSNSRMRKRWCIQRDQAPQ